MAGGGDDGGGGDGATTGISDAMDSPGGFGASDIGFDEGFGGFTGAEMEQASGFGGFDAGGGGATTGVFDAMAAPGGFGREGRGIAVGMQPDFVSNLINEYVKSPLTTPGLLNMIARNAGRAAEWAGVGGTSESADEAVAAQEAALAGNLSGDSGLSQSQRSPLTGLPQSSVSQLGPSPSMLAPWPGPQQSTATYPLGPAQYPHQVGGIGMTNPSPVPRYGTLMRGYRG